MDLHTLQANPSNATKNRVGRGIAAGQGKTAGRGTKGQKSRSGHNIPKKFEGGQTPLILRLPKVRGQKHQRVINQTVDRSVINAHFKDGDTITPASLLEKGLIKSTSAPVKILGNSPLTVSVTFEDIKQSKTSE